MDSNHICMPCGYIFANEDELAWHKYYIPMCTYSADFDQKNKAKIIRSNRELKAAQDYINALQTTLNAATIKIAELTNVAQEAQERADNYKTHLGGLCSQMQDTVLYNRTHMLSGTWGVTSVNGPVFLLADDPYRDRVKVFYDFPYVAKSIEQWNVVRTTTFRNMTILKVKSIVIDFSPFSAVSREQQNPNTSQHRYSNGRCYIILVDNEWVYIRRENLEAFWRCIQ